MTAGFAAPGDEGLQPLAIDVVSVQSQVVYGRVGNNVAVPTLEAFGLAVAAVPTVLLSNTPHYPTLHGGALPLEWFAGYLDDLVARGALSAVRAVVSGYLGNAGQADALARWIEQLRLERRDLLVVLDPVIGDHDHGVYVAPELVEAYRSRLLPAADGLTPNGFELAQLARRLLPDLDSVFAAARSLLVGRTRWVVVTSACPEGWHADEMQLAVVTRDATELLTHRRIDIAPKGTGDLFSAALTARLLDGESVVDAAVQASERVLAALERTQRARSAELLLPPRFTAVDE